MSLETVVVDLIISGKLVDALNSGYEATSDAVSDVADAALQGACPAYASAMTLAQQAAQAANTATVPVDINGIRHKIFREISETIGLAYVIKQLVRAWHELPALLRENVMKIARAGKSIRDFFSDPDLAKLLDIGKNVGVLMTMAYATLAHAVSYLADKAASAVSGGAEWLYDYASDRAADAARLFARIGEQALVKIVNAVYSSKDAVITGALGVSPESVVSVWNAASNGDLVEAGEQAVEAVISAPTDAVSAGYDALASVFG